MTPLTLASLLRGTAGMLARTDHHTWRCLATVRYSHRLFALFESSINTRKTSVTPPSQQTCLVRTEQCTQRSTFTHSRLGVLVCGQWVPCGAGSWRAAAACSPLSISSTVLLSLLTEVRTRRHALTGSLKRGHILVVRANSENHYTPLLLHTVPSFILI